MFWNHNDSNPKLTIAGRAFYALMLIFGTFYQERP